MKCLVPDLLQTQRTFKCSLNFVHAPSPLSHPLAPAALPFAMQRCGIFPAQVRAEFQFRCDATTSQVRSRLLRGSPSDRWSRDTATAAAHSGPLLSSARPRRDMTTTAAWE